VSLIGAALAVVMAMGGGGTAAERPPVLSAAPSPTARPVTSLTELLVRDGDAVAASGQVQAFPGEPVRLCAPRADGLVLFPPDHLPDRCGSGVTLVGADLTKLDGREERKGIVTGNAWIQGTYRAGTITVTEQGAPRQPAPEPIPFPTRTPCDPPAGGWVHTSDLPGLDALQSFIGAHGDHYGEIVITYPDGPPAGPTDSPAYAATQVALVTTTIDPARAYRELRTVYKSNLCVTGAARTRAAVVAVGQRLGPAIRRHPGQISSYGADFYSGHFSIELDVLDESWLGDLVRADAGTGILDAKPWLRPVR
jgi:hypothetical protein